MLGIGIEAGALARSSGTGLSLPAVDRIAVRFSEQKERVRAQAEAILAHFDDESAN